MKTKIIPFDLETAKKIQAGEIEGRIKTNNGENVRIVCWNRIDNYDSPIIALYTGNNGIEIPLFCNVSGKSAYSYKDLVIEVPDNEPQFKPFDKVLVRMNIQENWCCDFFSHMNGDTYVCICDSFTFCIPYEGNEHLVGTTDKPKEE